MGDGCRHPSQKYKCCHNIIDMDTASTTTTSNSSSTMGDTNPPESSGTFLQQLRTRVYYGNPGISYLKKMTDIIQNQSKFPLKIRETIQVTTDEHGQNPEKFCNTVSLAFKELLLSKPKRQKAGNGQLGYIWNGLDSEVDTEEEVEVAIRVFPNAFVYLIERHYCWRFSLESIPFVPLIFELKTELENVGLSSGSKTHELIHDLVFDLNFYFNCRELYSEEDLDRRLDDTCVKVLLRMREKGLLQTNVCGKYNETIRNALLDIMYVRSSRSLKTIRFLIDWDPTVLKSPSHIPLMWKYFAKFCYRGELPYAKKKDMAKIFQAIFELTMSHYPGDFGFVFDPSCRDAFCRACYFIGPNFVIPVFGELISKSSLEQFQNIVDMMLPVPAGWIDSLGHLGHAFRETLAEVVWKSAHRRSEKILALVATAASNRITEGWRHTQLEELYFFLRRDPAAVFAPGHEDSR